MILLQSLVLRSEISVRSSLIRKQSTILNKRAKKIPIGSSICYQQGIILVADTFFTSHHI